MSLVIDLIGQLNCHVIGCKTRQTTDTPGFKPFTILLLLLLLLLL